MQSETHIPDAPGARRNSRKFMSAASLWVGGFGLGVHGGRAAAGEAPYRLDGAPQTRWSPAMEAGRVFDVQLRGCVVRELCACQKRSGWVFWYLTVLKAHGN